MHKNGISLRLSITILFLAVMIFAALPTQPAQAGTVDIYNAIPTPLPPSMPSVGFQATSTYEFGDYIQLAGTLRDVDEVTVTMVTWALFATYPSMSSSGWTHPITLKIYNVVPGTPNTVGTLIATRTQTFDIPWRPAEDPVNCPTKSAAGYPYKWQSTPGAPDTNCNNGYAFNLTFDMSSLDITLPDNIIISIAYNTQSRGYSPIGVGGPYDSLNVGAQGTPTVGTDADADKVFMYSTWSGAYSDNGTGGVSVFREDTDWSPYGSLPVQIKARDGIFPTSTGSSPATGATLTKGPAELTVTFSEDVIHDGSSVAADNTSNYRLFEAGSDGDFDTVDCGSGIAPADVAFSINNAVYDPTTFTTTLSINGGTALPDGIYSLLACGTTSIEDSDGYELNAGLMDSSFTFTVANPAQTTAARCDPTRNRFCS